MEKFNVLMKMYDILRFLNFLYLPQIIQFSYLNLFRINWEYVSIILSFFSYSLEENNKLLPFNTRLKNPVQKYRHIIELYACILKIFSVKFWLFMNCLIFPRIYLTPKLSKYVTLPSFTYKVVQWVPIDLYSSRFIMYAPSFILDKLFLEWTLLNLGSSIFVFQNQLNDKVALKIFTCSNSSFTSSNNSFTGSYYSSS